jgi:hypothetical protein
MFTLTLAIRDNPPNLYINNNDVEGPQEPQKLIAIPNINMQSEVPAVKFLGIYIDPLLNFKFHIEKTSRKLPTALFFLRKSKNFLTMKALNLCTILCSILCSSMVYTFGPVPLLRIIRV